MLGRLKLDIDEIIKEKLSKIPLSVWKSKTTTFCDLQMGGGQYIKAIVKKLREFGHSDKNIKHRVYGFSENELYLSYVISYTEIIGTFDIYRKDINMKFDVIVGNPPYQKAVGPSKKEPIWDLFVEKSFSLLNEGGYLCLIHPSGWRNVDGRFKYIQKMILEKDIIYLEIHNEKDGLKTFGAETRYDFYVIHNVKSNKSTKIKFQNGEEGIYDISNMEFIPNAGMRFIQTLISHSNEMNIEIIHNNIHHTQSKYMSDVKTSLNKYPCIYTVRNGDIPTFWYSPFNNKGHFGRPKLVFSNGRISSIGSVIDIDGEYGLCQFSSGIVDTVENLPLIKKAFDSKKFRNLMEYCSVSDMSINYKILSTFKKDFWKEFIDD
jgi:hypothetical protein